MAHQEEQAEKKDQAGNNQKKNRLSTALRENLKRRKAAPRTSSRPHTGQEVE